MGYLPIGPGACQNNKCRESDKIKTGPLAIRGLTARNGVPVAPLRYRGKHRKRHSGHFPAATKQRRRHSSIGGIRTEKIAGTRTRTFLLQADPRIAADMRRKYGRRYT